MVLSVAPDTGRRALPVDEAAGPIWRIWHLATRTPAANTPRPYGPLHRFDPHPPGPPSHHDEVLVLYGSLAFEVSALEVFARGPSEAHHHRDDDYRPMLLRTSSSTDLNRALSGPMPSRFMAGLRPRSTVRGDGGPPRSPTSASPAHGPERAPR